MVLAILVGVRPFERFIRLWRRTKSNDHRPINLLHHLCLGYQHRVLLMGRIGDDVPEDERIFTQFGSDEPVDSGGRGRRICIWINGLRDDAVFLDEVLWKMSVIAGNGLVR